MWIRTQDKTMLIDCSEFEINRTLARSKKYWKLLKEYQKTMGLDKAQKTANNKIGEEGWEYVNNIRYKDITLATYSTKERCLEVLDEIQQVIVNLATVRNMQGSMSSQDYLDLINFNAVYQMPKEV
jgi:hypothetical protein